jgi:hypothetical protein
MRDAARALIAGALALAMLLGLGDAVVRAASPILQQVFEHLMPEFRVLTFGVDHERADRVMRVTVTRQKYVLMGGRAIEPNAQGNANASTLALQTLFGPLLALWVAMSWPLRLPWLSWPYWRLLATRLALALPPALALGLLDTPVVLAAELWALMLEHFSPGETSALVLAADVLQRGGRLALGLAIGAASVALANRGGRVRSAQ